MEEVEKIVSTGIKRLWSHHCKNGGFHIDDRFSTYIIIYNTKYGTLQLDNYFDRFELYLVSWNEKQLIIRGDHSLSHEEIFRYLKSVEKNMIFT